MQITKIGCGKRTQAKKTISYCKKTQLGVVDIGAINKIHQELIRMRDMGHAILLVSNEIEEIMGLSDRIYVMANGQLSEPLSSAQVTASKLGELMLSRTDSDISEKSETMQSQ